MTKKKSRNWRTAPYLAGNFSVTAVMGDRVKYRPKWCLQLPKWCLQLPKWCLQLPKWCLQLPKWCLQLPKWCLQLPKWCLQLFRRFKCAAPAMHETRRLLHFDKNICMADIATLFWNNYETYTLRAQIMAPSVALWSFTRIWCSTNTLTSAHCSQVFSVTSLFWLFVSPPPRLNSP